MEPQHNEQKKLPDKTNTQQILKTNASCEPQFN